MNLNWKLVILSIFVGVSIAIIGSSVAAYYGMHAHVNQCQKIEIS